MVAALLLVLQKAYQLLLLVAKISLTMTVKTLILNLLLKSHVIAYLNFIQLLLPARSVTILKDGKQILNGWSMMKTFKVFSVNTVKSGKRQAGTWVTKPFNNWKKAVAKMKEHAESEGHIHACQVETNSATALLRGSIAQQL